MTDIVERLRQFGDGSVHLGAVFMMCAAVDEVERLRKENAAQCEEIDRLHEKIKLQNKDWCDDDEAIKQQALRVLPKEVVDGDSVHVPRMGELAEMMADEIERLRKENELLRLGWCKESEKRMKEWQSTTVGTTGCEICNNAGHVEVTYLHQDGKFSTGWSKCTKCNT